MAIYVICPHCLHPTVVRRGRTGRARVCRQCNLLYVINESPALAADAIPVRTGTELGLLRQHQPAPSLMHLAAV
ncbi:MAG: hypothetical protein JXQ73_28105 [Phycisphaerae bacterium]|nr:hypothetical protein [Phycisphaerae bacterium]